MAASTHLFGRIGLKYVGTDPKSKDIRDFVRLSMANLWDEAQGPSEDASCPRIPPLLLKYYYSSRLFFIREFPLEPFVITVRKSEVTNAVVKGNSNIRSPFDGGNITAFLASLFWTTGLRCVVFRRLFNVWVDESSHQLYDTGTEMHLQDSIVDVVRRHMVPFEAPAFGLFDICMTMTRHNPRLDNQQHGHEFHQMLIRLHSLLAPLSLAAIVINFVNDDMSNSHVVCAYPCLKGGHVKFILCNSNGDECYTDMKRAYDMMDRLGCPKIHTMCIAVQRK